MNIEAKYKRTVNGLADYDTYLDGQKVCVGGLPRRVRLSDGKHVQVKWTLISKTPNYRGEVQGEPY